MATDRSYSSLPRWDVRDTKRRSQDFRLSGPGSSPPLKARYGASALRSPHHSSPPVSTYRNGTNGMRPKIAHASFEPRAMSVRVARSSHIRTTAMGWRKQTSSSRSFFMVSNLPARLEPNFRMLMEEGALGPEGP